MSGNIWSFRCIGTPKWGDSFFIWMFSQAIFTTCYIFYKNAKLEVFMKCFLAWRHQKHIKQTCLKHTVTKIDLTFNICSCHTTLECPTPLMQILFSYFQNSTLCHICVCMVSLMSGRDSTFHWICITNGFSAQFLFSTIQTVTPKLILNKNTIFSSWINGTLLLMKMFGVLFNSNSHFGR